MNSLSDLLTTLVRNTGILFLPFGLILIGGLFVMADVVLLKRRGDAEGVSSFLGTGMRPRAGLRLASVFFFTLASMLAAKDLLHLLRHAHALVIPIAFGLLATLLSFLILLFGILLSRALGEALHASLPIRAFSRLAHWLTVWIDPLAELGWATVAFVLRLLRIDRTKTAEQSEEEVLQMMDEGLESGAFDPVEKEMVEGRVDDTALPCHLARSR